MSIKSSAQGILVALHATEIKPPLSLEELYHSAKLRIVKSSFIYCLFVTEILWPFFAY